MKQLLFFLRVGLAIGLVMGLGLGLPPSALLRKVRVLVRGRVWVKCNGKG